MSDQKPPLAADTLDGVVRRFRHADAATLGKIIKYQRAEWRDALAAWRHRYGHEFPVLAIVNAVEVRDLDHLDYQNAVECGPKSEKREWACNRCNYAWNGNGGVCPCCSHDATHGDLFDPAKHRALVLSPAKHTRCSCWLL